MSVNLLSIVQGKDGRISSIRVGFLLTLVTVLANWSYVNYEKKDLLAIPDNATSLIVGLAGARVAQGYVQAKTGTYAPVVANTATSGSLPA
jgi:hypothetical protein